MAEATTESLNPLELEQERKVARRLLKTPAGLQALRDVTGYHFVIADEAEKQNKPIVAVLTPSHQGFKPETSAAFQKLVPFSQPQCVVYPEPAVSASIVHWVRNDLLCRLYKSGKPFDYVLFMDDDIVPPEDGLVKLLAHGKDIVAGACTVRQDPPLPNFRIYEPDTFVFRTAFEWNGEGLLDVGGVGTGFMLISRVALEKVADYYLNCQHEKKYLGMTEEAAERISKLRFENLKESCNAWWFECLKQPNGSGEYGEDLSFCFKARECGIPVYVDTTVKCGHIGNYPYSLDDYWDYQAGKLKEEKHRQMFCAATGRPTGIAVRPEGEKIATAKVSVLIPSRGRPELLRESVQSLLNNAEGAVEVLIRLDGDEPRDAALGVWELAGVKIEVGQRYGYTALHKYYNELAEQATGDWLVLWNDDALMQTPGWDTKIHAQGGGLKVLNATGQLNLFPIFSKRLYDVLGHVSLQTHCDSWLQVVGRMNGIEYPVELAVKHQREDIEDQTKTETQGAYSTTQPEFFSLPMQEKLLEDVNKVKDALA